MKEIFNNITGIFSKNKLVYISLDNYYMSTNFRIKETKDYYQVQTRTVITISETLSKPLSLANFLNFSDLVDLPFSEIIVEFDNLNISKYKNRALTLTFFGLFFSIYFNDSKSLKEILQNKFIKIYYIGTSKQGKYHDITVAKNNYTKIELLAPPEMIFMRGDLYGIYSTTFENDILRIQEKYP